MTLVEFQTQLVSLEGSLERYAYSLTLNKEDAHDLVQETYLKALMYKEKYIYNDNFKAWIYTIMRNTFINNYRRNVRENTHKDNTKETYYLNQPGSNGYEDPASSFAAKELAEQVERLDDDLRLPFMMHNQGYKYKEIAEKLNLNIGTVKSRIFFSRKKLMEQLKDYAS
jgi:RNA polymerase sigma-70 factor (ECF subfamily)